MSRIGKQPIEIPGEVEVKIEGQKIIISGSKGELDFEFDPEIKVETKEGKIFVDRKNDSKNAKSLHGLTRTLIFNMIEGITKGFERNLELVGLGFRAKKEGEKLVLTVGFSHPVEFIHPEGVLVEVSEKTKIKVSGIDKGKVGQVAASIRAIKPPEPYKGKGIRYEGEKIRLKPGKAGKVGAGETK